MKTVKIEIADVCHRENAIVALASAGIKVVVETESEGLSHLYWVVFEVPDENVELEVE